MVKEIRWTPEAVSTFHHVIEYLIQHWSEKEVEHFVQSTQKIVEFIAKNPRMFRSTIHNDVREALVTPHNLLIYKIHLKLIDL